MHNKYKTPHLLIRADANSEIGTGHVMRMIALAQAYQDRGGEITFAHKTCPKPIIERLERENFNSKHLQNDSTNNTSDVQETIKLGKKLDCKWIVIDGYQFNFSYQKFLKKAGFKILLIDDHCYSKNWDVDIITNPNPTSLNFDYNVNTTLLGSNYTLLRKEIINNNKQGLPKKTAKIKNLLINFGGADSQNVTLQLITLLNTFTDYKLNIHIVLGPAYKFTELLNSVSSKSPHHITILNHVQDMASQYLWADGFVGAAGSITWELLYYDIRSALIPTASNQLNIIDFLITNKLAHVAGSFLENKSKLMENVIINFIKNPNLKDTEQPKTISIDGKGAKRLAAALDDQLKICIITSPDSWIMPYLDKLTLELKNKGHIVNIATNNNEVTHGDILFILSYPSILPNTILNLNTHNLVVHASNLPKGRGWSPWIWEIINGKNEITISLIEADTKVDTGVIYSQVIIPLTGYELIDSLRHLLFKYTLHLCVKTINNFPDSLSKPKNQLGVPSYYRKRTPKDSELNPDKTIREQFNLLRTVDNQAYPAYFKIGDHKYRIKIESISK